MDIVDRWICRQMYIVDVWMLQIDGDYKKMDITDDSYYR
jgi:hypothetical protein